VAKFIPVEPEKWEKMVKAWAENVRLETENGQLQTENARLKAEVERLTKAGDEMAAVITQYRCSPFGRKVPNAFTVWDAWFAAKKGGQP
jgi:uncharacterized protein YlxW (UPF0749 family)